MNARRRGPLSKHAKDAKNEGDGGAHKNLTNEALVLGRHCVWHVGGWLQDRGRMPYFDQSPTYGNPDPDRVRTNVVEDSRRVLANAQAKNAQEKTGKDRLHT